MIFLSNFVGLLIKVDAPGKDSRNVLGALLVAINVVLVLAVLVTSWFTTQQQVIRSIPNGGVLTMTHPSGSNYCPQYPFNA